MGQDGTYTPLQVTNLWGKSEQELRANSASYLFIDVSNFETQWQGKQPHLDAGLRDAGALTQLGEAQGWTLFRIQ